MCYIFDTTRHAFGTARYTFDTTRYAFGTARYTFSTARQAFGSARNVFDPARDAFVSTRDVHDSALPAASTRTEEMITYRWGSVLKPFTPKNIVRTYNKSSSFPPSGTAYYPFVREMT